MRYTLSWAQPAQSDLFTILHFIAQDNLEAAEALQGMIHAKAESLKVYPRMGRKGRQAGTHEVVVHAHYIIVYKVLKNCIRIIRILHTAQRYP